jgi:3-hydroxyacyl-CoA dehydrogenase/enoyl-CoA hydratase/3-hydroxybutyryl-CoA epimerase
MNTELSETETPVSERRYWSLNLDTENIAWLAIDCPGQTSNTLSSAVLEELTGIVDELERTRPRGVVFFSTKSSGFIVGADVNEFENLTDPDETVAMIKQVHKLFVKIENLPFPTVARLHGFCLGGGLELALACRYRVALDEPSTRLGLPEVLLGIHPGFGGTVRLVERVGVFRAMEMMLTGKNLDARRAEKSGLVDRAVPARHLDNAVQKLLRETSPPVHSSVLEQFLHWPVVRHVVATVLRRQVAKRAPEQHYPAPYALIRLWQDYGGRRSEMFSAEAVSIAELFVSSASRNLQRLFFLQERLKTIGRGVEFPIKHVHVIGAGTMGGDIAAWCAMRGLRVTMEDREIKYVAPAILRAHKTYRSRIRDRYRRLAVSDNLVVDLDGDGLAQADVIIEAIIEDLGIKRTLFQRIESLAKPDALIATNTSSIPLEAIAAGMQEPSRLVGVHFFNPVAKMQLIEIIGAKNTARLQLDRAAAFALLIDRQPLPAISAPGFLINRILSPYLQEAMAMIDEGISPVVIDEVAVEFGMPMGPIELADTVGLDICLSVGEVLAEKLGGEVPQILRAKVEQGATGRKTNRGFYRYEGKRVIRPKAQQSDVPLRDVRDRMMLRLVNESVACLREGVVADSDLIDVGMVFGTGFAPFRGGPIHYAYDRGVPEILARLEQLSQTYGERFAPDPGWGSLEP